MDAAWAIRRWRWPHESVPQRKLLLISALDRALDRHSCYYCNCLLRRRLQHHLDKDHLFLWAIIAVDIKIVRVTQLCKRDELLVVEIEGFCTKKKHQDLLTHLSELARCSYDLEMGLISSSQSSLFYEFDRCLGFGVVVCRLLSVDNNVSFVG